MTNATGRPAKIKGKVFSVVLTEQELLAVVACITGELDNDDGMSPYYFNPLRRAVRKLAQARKVKP